MNITVTMRSSNRLPDNAVKTASATSGAIIAGAPAPTAEALMRSRYSAFALGDTDYLADTLAPEARGDFDPIEASNTASDAIWQGLLDLAVGRQRPGRQMTNAFITSVSYPIFLDFSWPGHGAAEPRIPLFSALLRPYSRRNIPANRDLQFKTRWRAP